jgi:hypothetical protein
MLLSDGTSIIVVGATPQLHPDLSRPVSLGDQVFLPVLYDWRRFTR